MCGIVGIFNLNEEPVSRNILKRMTRQLSHRGPDDEGFFIKNNLGLGHRRLSIIDTSPLGSQPMVSKDGNWVVVFNGCIYNFQELKLDLKSKGHIFVSGSDTEVLVEGLAEYGPTFFQELNGMFAIGAWNTNEKSLYLSRDRYGVKPLYYWYTGNKFLFASEIKAFLKHPDFKVDLNFAALNEYFTFQNLFRYHTLFKDVTMLPPANTVNIKTDIDEFKHHSWWDYDFSEPDETMSFEDARTELLRLMKKCGGPTNGR